MGTVKASLEKQDHASSRNSSSWSGNPGCSSALPEFASSDQVLIPTQGRVHNPLRECGEKSDECGMPHRVQAGVPHGVRAEMPPRVHNGMPQGPDHQTGEEARAEVLNGSLRKEDLYKFVQVRDSHRLRREMRKEGPREMREGAQASLRKQAA